ncbi:hypothetical protein [Vreelandella utahensis]|uniref:hypothetical protein n=1 Tax=Vreelandella halophila TaxID=86177 RepID=UPI00098504FA|nr:hypothetical protein [Halomonas utahensis]
MSRRKQSVRLYLDVDTYRQLLVQAANTQDVKTPSDYAAQLLAEGLNHKASEQALNQKAGESAANE